MSILDELGVQLPTKFNYTHWVSLRELIDAVLEAVPRDELVNHPEREEDDE